MKHFSESNLAIVGTARNVANYIQRVHKVLCKATINFRSQTFFVVESYSEDSTVDVLRAIAAKNKNFSFASIESEREMPQLSVRIAQARNTAADMAFSYGPFDYVLVADLDNVNRNLTAPRLESCWKYPKWDMMSANQPHAYYDTWALRHPIISPGDCWRQYEELLAYLPAELAKKIAVTNRVISIPKSCPPIPVNSAFGGLAMYTADAYFDSSYSGLTSNGIEICEHVPFNQKLTNSGYKLYINPGLVNLNSIHQATIPIKTKLKKFLI
jgi:glycosyltransferase involved in cell wall biosynthesis